VLGDSEGGIGELGERMGGEGVGLIGVGGGGGWGVLVLGFGLGKTCSWSSLKKAIFRVMKGGVGEL